MDIIQAFILAVFQGVTEFLPISSSAHLILLPYLLGWTDQGLVYDVAAHVGTLAAVVLYFRHELQRIVGGGVSVLRRQPLDQDGKLFWLLVAASIPIAVGGYLLHDFASGSLRSPLIIAVANIVFAGLLWWADSRVREVQSLDRIGWREAIVIGLSQVLAIIPGASRSGITMTAGLFMNMSRQVAARFSFLLAIPTILMAGGYEAYRLATQSIEADWTSVTLMAGLSFVSALLAIHWFLKLLDRFGMMPYVIYRLVLGCLLLILFI